jgi:hypothetical protein
MRRHLTSPVALEAISIDSLREAARRGDAGQPSLPAVTNDEATLNPAATDPALVVTADLPEQQEHQEDFTAELAEITLLDEQVDEAADVVQGLDEVADVIAAAPEGEITDAAVKLAAVAVESLFDRVGYAVALEDADGKLDSGKSLLDKIADGVKAIWEKIIQAIDKAREWLVGFFLKLVDRSARVKKNALALAAKLGDLEGQPKEKTFTNGALAARLQTGNAKLPKRIGDAAMTTHNLLVLQLKRIDADAAQGKQMAELLVKSPEKFSYNADKRRQASRLSGMASVRERGNSFGNNMAVSEVLLGGKIIGEEVWDPFYGSHLHKNRTETGTGAILSMSHTPRLVTATAGEYLPGTAADMQNEPIPVENPIELRALCMLAGKMADEVGDFRVTQARLEAVCRELVRECKRLMAEPDTMRKIKSESRELDLRLFYHRAPRMFVREPAEFATEMLTAADSLLAYSSACGKFYSKAAKA